MAYWKLVNSKEGTTCKYKIEGDTLCFSGGTIVGNGNFPWTYDTGIKSISGDARVELKDDAYCMFYGCKNLKSLTGLANWNTSAVTYMNSMFEGCESLTNLTGLEKWNTGEVIDMSRMFRGCEKLKNLSGIKNWDTRSVMGVYRMFYNCSCLTSLAEIENWNTRYMIGKHFMFEGYDNIPY